MTDGIDKEPGFPCVGIFWGVPIKEGKGERVVVADRSQVADAVTYGDCLTHERGHYEVWETWQRLGPAGLHKQGLTPIIAWYEYEHFPRGRVVYNTVAERFVIYADRWLHGEKDVAMIVRAFGLDNETWSLKSDDHYRTRISV